MRELVAKIKNEYINEYGQLKFKKDEHPWDNDNPFLRTGQLNMLLKYKGFTNGLSEGNLSFRFEMLANFKKSINVTWLYWGLNTRHAPTNDYMESDKFDSISLDEHDGICFSEIALGWENQTAQLCKYGRDYGWYFNERDICGKPFPNSVLGYLKLIWGIINITYHAIITWDFSGSSEMDKVIFKHPEVVKLTRIRLPKDRAFIRLSAGYKAGLIGYIHLIISLFFSAYKEKPSGHNRSFYRLWVLKELGVNDIFFRKVKKYYIKRMKEHYNCEEEDILYFITQGFMWNKDNPLIELSKGVKL